jgi:hypothetical protein
MFKWLHDFLKSDEPLGLIKTDAPNKMATFMHKRYASIGSKMVDGFTIAIGSKTIVFNNKECEEIKTIGVM